MGSYLVLARKWRSAQFSDIVGQGHIVRTLMNSVRFQRVHQAYLFTGSRGIGKTSIARIFAKVLRCQSVTEKDGWLLSCDQCSSCKEIASGNSVDVIEIDGASNNGVDAVREIRESARFLPSSGQTKIYIIDEVHMLTTAAFNALLKTLEEPPPHVVFIFATTEPHKIPATILSRCQRYDFKRATVSQIQAHAAKIALAEGLKAEPGALALIARAAEGSMRDALSLLDQVIAFAGENITATAVRESVGLVGNSVLMKLLREVLGRKPLDAVATIAEVYSQGQDLRVLAKSLIEMLHAVILAKVGATSQHAADLYEEEWKDLCSLAELRPLEELELIFQVLHHGIEAIARSSQPKIVLDILLIKCASAEILVSVDHTSPSTPAHGTSRPSAPASSRSTPNNPTLSSTAPSVAPAPVVASAVAAPAPKGAPAPRPFQWEEFIQHVRGARPLLASHLEHASATYQDGLLTLTLSSQDSHKAEQLKSRTISDQLRTLTDTYFGRAVGVVVQVQENTGESIAMKKERTAREQDQRARDAVMNNPIIQEAKALFGGNVESIEFTGENSR